MSQRRGPAWASFTKLFRETARHRHRYEGNNAYRPKLEESGLVISGRAAEADLVEFVELPRSVHPYYLATQAHPEFLSRPTRAHPLFAGLVRAALERRELAAVADEKQVSPMNSRRSPLIPRPRASEVASGMC